MKGKVVDGRACLDVYFRPAGQPRLAFEFVIDTGFEGALALPEGVVAALQLQYYQRITAQLADHSVRLVDAHEAIIEWQGKFVSVAVLAMGERPLLGTALLEGNEVHIRFDEGGDVVIEPIKVA